MHKPEFVLINKTHRILWEFVIQTDLITARKAYVMVIIKKKLAI